MKYDVFISYSRKDLSLVEKIVNSIQKDANINCWVDLKGIYSGAKSFEDVIIKAIEDSKIVLFMLSENSMNSENTKREIVYAESIGKHLILVNIRNCELQKWYKFHFGLADQIAWNNNEQRNKLLRDLRELAKPQASLQPTPLQEQKNKDNKSRFSKFKTYASTFAALLSGVMIMISFLNIYNNNATTENKSEEIHKENSVDITETKDKNFSNEILEMTSTQQNQNIASGNTTSNLSAVEMYKKGANAYIASNYTEAVKWYRKAAEQGNADAQYDLGVCYDLGQGVTQDEAEAVKWYRKVAEQGDASAQYDLGFCYDLGQGVTKDVVEAVKWYRKAAEQGDASAQCNLGYCYQYGIGVPKNLNEAVIWYREAAKQNSILAQSALKILGETW